jgi:hypothetical protein
MRETKLANGMKIKRVSKQNNQIPPGYILIDPIVVNLKNGDSKQIIAINPSNGKIKFSRGRINYIGNLSCESKNEIGNIIVALLKK